MSKSILLLLISLCCAGVTIAQQSIFTEQDFDWAQPGVYCNVESKVVFSTDSSVRFTFIHPQFGDLSSTDKIHDFIISENSWTAATSHQQIVEGTALFNKTADLQINYSIFGTGALSPNIARMAYWVWLSTQCGAHATRTVHSIRGVCQKLGIAPPLMVYISIEGHQVFAYWNPDMWNALTQSYGKWVVIDPDPGTFLYKYPDGYGGDCSIEELLANVSVILLPESDPVNLELKKTTAERARQHDHTFWSAVSAATVAIDTFAVPVIVDSAVMEFGITEGMELVFQQHSEKKFVLDTSGGYGGAYLMVCDSGFQQGDHATIDTCIAALAANNGITQDQLWEIITDTTISIIMDRNDTTTSPNDVGGEFVTLWVEPGIYKFNFNMPLPLRSVSTGNPGESIMVNTSIRSDGYFNQVYLPTLSDGNLLPTYDSLLVGTSYLEIPPEAGRTQLTFYFNYRMFNFVEGEREVAVLAGNLIMDQTSASYALDLDSIQQPPPVTVIEETLVETKLVTMYPNPTTGIVNFSQQVDARNIIITDLQGRNVIQNGLGPVTSIDLSDQPAGMYLVNIFSQESRTWQTQKIYKTR